MYGKYTLLDKPNDKVYAYTREGDGKKILVVLNFSATNAQANLKMNLSKSKILLSNYNDTKSNVLALRPYEAVVFEIEK